MLLCAHCPFGVGYEKTSSPEPCVSLRSPTVEPVAVRCSLLAARVFRVSLWGLEVDLPQSHGVLAY